MPFSLREHDHHESLLLASILHFVPFRGVDSSGKHAQIVRCLIGHITEQVCDAESKYAAIDSVKQLR